MMTKALLIETLCLAAGIGKRFSSLSGSPLETNTVLDRQTDIVSALTGRMMAQMGEKMAGI